MMIFPAGLVAHCLAWSHQVRGHTRPATTQKDPCGPQKLYTFQSTAYKQNTTALYLHTLRAF